MDRKIAYKLYSDDIEKIVRVDFSIYGNQDIINNSVISESQGITTASVDDNGEVVNEGVNSRKLGVTDRRSVCLTCGEMALYCPGHFGHIRLAEPAFHMGYQIIVKDILSCVCIRCHKLLVNKKKDNIVRILKTKFGLERFSAIKELCKKVTHCEIDGTPAHNITIEKKQGSKILLVRPRKKNKDESDKKSMPQMLSAQLCYDILKFISDEDYQVMGFDPQRSRPENMIIVNFPVPPVPVRPSIQKEEGDSMYMDDLTHKLTDIIRSNENLKDSKGGNSLIKSNNMGEDQLLLQCHVATFFANDIAGMPKSQQKNKKPTKSVSERLKGKEGRIRGNLMGKRVDMSSRSVITSDPNIAINEVGVPIIIAKRQTFPEIVTEHNIKYLRQLVKNGRDRYPGANYVFQTRIDDQGRESRNCFQLRDMETPVNIKIGDIVERHLVNGDIIIFNRQPTLHKLSMMGHICHIINDHTLKTFRLNVNVTDPYNADFDGDEMNAHIPQSIQTVCETRIILNASKRFINPSTSRMAMNAKQDTAMGIYTLTKDKTIIDWKFAMNLLMKTNRGLSTQIEKYQDITGKQLFSLLLGSDINIAKRNDDGGFSMRIKNGKLLDGTLTKSDISGIAQKIWKRYGSSETTHFFDNLQRMMLSYLMIRGFTVGIGDMVIPKESHQFIYDIIETARKKVSSSITEYENDHYIMTAEAFEEHTKTSLQTIQGDIQKKAMQTIDPDGGLFNTITSGSNGTETNAGQIAGCVGQIIVEGKRIAKKYNNRAFPMFYQFDDSAIGRGFCVNSFTTGLNPPEMWFHVISGREGVIDTQIKTAETGYVQRKFVKSLEDIKVEYDGTVRNANGKIIQCVYGDNGISTEKQIEQKIGLITANNQTVRTKYVYTEDEWKIMEKKINSKYTLNLNEKLYRKLIFLRNKMRKIQKSVNTTEVSFSDVYYMPVDLNFIVNIVINKDKRQNKTVVDPYYVLQNIKKMYTDQHVVLRFKEDSVIKKRDEQQIKLCLKFFLFDVLSPKRCTDEYQLSLEEFDLIVSEYNKAVSQAKVDSGEMVGILGAQGIGEPVTQLNLRSFQRAGIGKTVTSGLGRIKELNDATKNIKTPVTKIVLEDAYKKDKFIAAEISANLKYTTLKDVVETAEIYYDPNVNDKNGIMKRDGISHVFFSGSGSKQVCQENIKNMPWLLRLKLSKERMNNRRITLLEIKTSFCKNWSRIQEGGSNKTKYGPAIQKITKVAILSNYDNSPEPTVHIRFNANNYNTNTLVSFQEIVIEMFKIKGLDKITESNSIVEEPYVTFDDEGNVITEKQFVIFAEGNNLEDFTKISGISMENSFTNNVVTIYETYGIEAAKTALIKEFKIAIESSGGTTGYHHLALLMDTMTFMGSLVPFNRHGADKLDTDPLARASFEETVEQLLHAAAYSKTDYVRSISSQVMLGQLINAGTGAFDILIDHDKIKQSMPKTEKIKQSTFVKQKGIAADLLNKKREGKL